MMKYPKSSENIILPSNPADALSLVGETVRHWNMWQFPNTVAATITAKTMSVDILKSDGIYLKNSEIYSSQAFCIIKTQEPAQDFMFTDNITIRQLSLREFEMFLWNIADWDLRNYPFSEYRRRFPKFILETLAFDAYWLHKEMDFWKYVTPSPNCVRDHSENVELILGHLMKTASFARCKTNNDVKTQLMQYYDKGKNNGCTYDRK